MPRDAKDASKQVEAGFAQLKEAHRNMKKQGNLKGHEDNICGLRDFRVADMATAVQRSTNRATWFFGDNTRKVVPRR